MLYLNKKSILLILATTIWMVVIFIFSSEPAGQSSKLSGFVLEGFIRLITRVLGNEAAHSLSYALADQYIIRKTGHVLEYLVLGLLSCLTARSMNLKRLILYPTLFCIFYASTDEFHQLFVPGRGPAVTDVLLDSTAAFAAIILLRGIHRHHRRD